MRKTTKLVKVKNTNCTGYKIKYDEDGRPVSIRVTSDNGVVDLDYITMMQAMNDWETHPDEDFTFPQKYIFNVEAN